MHYALSRKASDIHLTIQDHQLFIQLRIEEKIVPLVQDIWDPKLFEYIKFLSGFDLTNPFLPQSGQFTWDTKDKKVFCRFSVIPNTELQTGVIRILNTGVNFEIEQLTEKKDHQDFLKSLVHARQGLVITCGPTNSGKTTTLHAIVHSIAIRSQHKVVSLEDPIEIEDPSYLQLQINEEIGFTYEKGIEELLRHDPDVILIGETRNAYTAKMVIRTALTGALAFTTLHASNTLEAIGRLKDLGISEYDLKNTLTALISQRLYTTGKGKECIYEILAGKDLQFVLTHQRYPKGFNTLADEIKEALVSKRIQDAQAIHDLEDFQRGNGTVHDVDGKRIGYTFHD